MLCTSSLGHAICCCSFNSPCCQLLHLYPLPDMSAVLGLNLQPLADNATQPNRPSAHIPPVMSPARGRNHCPSSGQTTTVSSVRFTLFSQPLIMKLGEGSSFFSSVSLVLLVLVLDLLILHSCSPPQPSCLYSHPFRPPPDVFVHLLAYARHPGSAHKMLA